MRYGLTPTKAQDRIEACLANLALNGCVPTFLTPGWVAKRYPLFIRHLQDKGAEIAVHSYDHIDLKALRPGEANKQLMKAAQTFKFYGIEAHGFRCPYLSCTDELVDVLPKGLFGYSSNVAILWDVNPYVDKNHRRAIFETINKFYQPRESQDLVCVPWMRNSMVEIPVCVPDDLQLCDGLHLDPEGIAEAWKQFLKQTYDRGELFTLFFHPELAQYCEQPFIALLQKAKSLKPNVWVARLRDISDWWREKSKFRSEISRVSTGLRISFNCSSRATILSKGLDRYGLKEAWDGPYFRVKTRTLDVPVEPHPFVGIASNVSGNVMTFLQDQGYILDMSETAPQCAIYLDDSALMKIGTQVELVNWIERSAGPLVRYWRWPDGAKSALSITGDLDALSLLDYLSRLFVR
jgi:hypothetical protein